MAWDGSGNFSRTNGTQSGAATWADADAAGNNITTSQHDTHDEDLADGIAACLTKNMETKPEAHFVSAADATYDLGTSAVKWRDLYLSRNAAIGGTLGVTGIASFADGSAAAPAITFSADPDTGIYRAAANQVALAAGGVVVGRGAYASGTGKSFSLDASASGEYVEIGASHSSNTASSQALLSATVAGGTAADPFAKFVITGGAAWSIGNDNSDSDAFKISRAITLGTAALRIDENQAIQTYNVAAATGYATAGDITLPATGKIRALNTAKAFVQFDGTGTPAIGDSFNVTSLTDHGAGEYTVNFTNAMSTATYSVAGFARTATVKCVVAGSPTSAPASGSCRIFVARTSDEAATDAPFVSVEFKGA